VREDLRRGKVRMLPDIEEHPFSGLGSDSVHIELADIARGEST